MFPAFLTVRERVVIFSGLIVLSGCAQKQGPAEVGTRHTNAVSVESLVIRHDTLSDIIYSTGSLIPYEKVELRNEVSGRVTGIYFEEGSHVTQGTLLLKIDDRDLQAQLNKIAVQEKMARDEEYRKRKLLEIKAISQEEYDVSNNQLQSVGAERQLLEAQIAKTEILAPLSGKIGLRNVSPGSFIPSNSVIATLQQTDRLKIEFSVPEKYNALIRKGIPLSFTVDYSTGIFTGTVYATEPGISEDTRTIRIRAHCSNPGGFLIPGSFARISLVLKEIPDAILIPSEAVVGDIKGNKVFIIREGKARTVWVETGIRTESQIQITEGLQPGDSLITTGLLQVSEGSPVLPAMGSTTRVTDKTTN